MVQLDSWLHGLFDAERMNALLGPEEDAPLSDPLPRCHLDCFFCYNDRNRPGTPLSVEQYRTLLEDLARMQTMFVMLTGGEPMVHPHFFEIGRMTKELGFVTRVRTKGHTLSPRDVAPLQEEVETPASCSVGVAGVDIDPFGNVQACMHPQESAGNLHEQSIEEIWNRSPLFTRARGRAIEAAARFGDQPLQQIGAPLFCLAVEEDSNKIPCSESSSCLFSINIS